MESELKSKIKKAEKLRESYHFPFNLFNSPDYISSGDLFCEVARECNSVNEQIKYFEEAANTFLLNKDDYGIYKASEPYKSLFNILKDVDFNKAVEYGIKHSDCLYKIGKYMMAGQAYVTLADIVKNKDEEKAMMICNKAKESYNKDGNCPFHLKKAVEECLLLELKNENLQNAIESFEILDKKYNMKYSRLSKHILCFLDQETDHSKMFAEEELGSQESQILMKLLNQSEDKAASYLKEYLNDNALPEHTTLVFKMAIDKLTGCDIS